MSAVVAYCVSVRCVLNVQENYKITGYEVGSVRGLANKLPVESLPTQFQACSCLGHDNFYFFVPLDNHLQKADLQKDAAVKQSLTSYLKTTDTDKF
jgi:hypothetical protein